jgi:hypothetical protein
MSSFSGAASFASSSLIFSQLFGKIEYVVGVTSTNGDTENVDPAPCTGLGLEQVEPAPVMTGVEDAAGVVLKEGCRWADVGMSFVGGDVDCCGSDETEPGRDGEA